MESHMPPDHQKYVQWDGDRFKRWATKVGDHTLAVVCSILESRKVEQQGYKAFMALLKLARPIFLPATRSRLRAGARVYSDSQLQKHSGDSAYRPGQAKRRSSSRLVIIGIWIDTGC